jgi:SAM-dependent methyltransferase
MDNHPLYGPSVPEMGWAPAPSYLLRRDRILRLIKRMQAGSVLEIGCGAGTLLYELRERGFVCQALESSPSALAVARYVNENSKDIHQSPQTWWVEKFDYVFAFEVLEHIENDRVELAAWHSWLKPSGLLLISVPAHLRKWTASDVWAGHFHRYERESLLALLSLSGFRIEHFETYGFPLANLIAPLRALVHACSLNKGNYSDNERFSNRAGQSSQSGVSRETELKLYPLMKSVPGRILMKSAFILQNWSSGRDWGTGYLVLARRSNPGQSCGPISRKWRTDSADSRQ